MPGSSRRGRKGVATGGWLALALVLALGACSEEEPQSVEAVKPARPFGNYRSARHAILISIDTLRADHLGCYGYERPITPNIDRLRASSVLFSQAIAQAPSTLPSHASMFSSLLPHHHGASFIARTRLPSSVTTLAEVFQTRGFRTGAFHGGGQMAAEFGLDQGFDVYRQMGPKASTQATVDAGLEWLRKQTGGRAFLFLHSYEVHHPYTPSKKSLKELGRAYRGPLPREVSKRLLQRVNRAPEKLEEEDLAHIVDTYDAEILTMDAAIGRLIGKLEKLGLYDQTAIVFTSDHGEEFGEHGMWGWHSHTLYDELLRVPLLLKLPDSKLAGERYDLQVRGLDVAPTLLAATGVHPPEEFTGISLLPWLEQSALARDLPAVSRQDADSRWSSTLRMDGHKLYPHRLYMVNEMRKAGPLPARGSSHFLQDFGMALRYRWRPYLLFDLEANPGERLEPAFTREPPLKRMADLLEALVGVRSAPPPERVETGKETEERLRALGYID